MDIKEKIVAASADLMLLYGVKGVTMDDVANRLGMSKRTIYEQFGDKKELVAAAVDYLLEKQKASYEKILADSDTIIGELQQLFRYFDANSDMRGRMARDIQKYYPEIYEKKMIEHYRASHCIMKEWLQRGVRQGIILPNVDIELSLHVLIDSVNEVAMRKERINFGDPSLVESFHYVMLYFFRGICTERGVELLDDLIEEQKLLKYER